MRRICTLFLTALLTLAACEQSDLPEAESRAPEEDVYHGMIQLGEKLDDPYTLANMQEALTKVYPTKAGRVILETTDLYVRFLPQDDNQLDTLRSRGLYLMDHPMDYSIVREGDYYQDPEVGDEDITWQYAVVPKDFGFPKGIRYEVLDECYFAENDKTATKADPDIDWTAVEAEAFRITGNEELWAAATKGGAVAPAGRITIEDPNFSGGKPFGVAGVQVSCNVFVKFASCYTTRDGYYQMPRTFLGNPRYRLVFQNEKSFSIGFNFILIPASVSTLGRGGNQGIDYHVTAGGDAALFRRCAVNNAAYDYFSRCVDTDLDITPPPGDLRFWIFPGLTASSASMLHHGAFLDHQLLQKYLGNWLFLIQLFLPDITIGTSGQENYHDIFKLVQHELAHASHWGKVGNEYWSPYVQYIIQEFVSNPKLSYGDGSGDGAGQCEVGEMWAYFAQASLMKDRYKTPMELFGDSYWFKPDILTSLYELGMTRGQIFRALKPGVTSTEDLREELIGIAPRMENDIIMAFNRYGK